MRMRYMKLMMVMMVLGAMVCGVGGCGRQKARTEAIEGPRNPLVARVGDYSVYQDDIIALILPSHGRQALDALVDAYLVERYLDEQGLVCTEGMINRERRRVLNDMAPEMDAQRQYALLDFILAARGMGRSEFELMIRTQAMLRCGVDKTVVILEEQLRQEYERQYGAQVQVRLVAVTNLRKLEAVKRELAGGAALADLVEAYSEEPMSLENGGVLGPFSADDGRVAEAVREAAFGLTEIGERSAVVNYLDKEHRQWWAIMELERVVEAQDVSFEAVRGELRVSLERQTITGRMQELREGLRKQAHVILYDTMYQSVGGGQ